MYHSSFNKEQWTECTDNFFSIDKNPKIRQSNVVMNNIGDLWFVSPETERCQKVHNICCLGCGKSSYRTC